VTLRRFRESFLSWKTKSITYLFVCACACLNVALLIQHATRMCHTVTSLVVPLAPLHFSTLSHKRRDIRKNVVEYKYRSDFLYNFCLEKFSEILSKMWKSLHVKYPYSCRILTKFEFSQRIFEKSLNFKFHPNPSSGSRVVPCGQTHGRTDMMKLIVAFDNLANAPRNT
jgi:hypothetical protein